MTAISTASVSVLSGREYCISILDVSFLNYIRNMTASTEKLGKRSKIILKPGSKENVVPELSNVF